MIKSLIPQNTIDETLYHVKNLQSDKNVAASLDYLSKQYSGLYLQQLSSFSLSDIDKDQFINSKSLKIYEAAKSYNPDKSLFSTHLFYISNFYIRDLYTANNKTKADSIEDLNHIQIASVIPDLRNELILKDIEEVIDNFLKKEKKPPHYGLVIKSRLLYNLKYHEIMRLIKAEYGIKTTKQRLQQIADESLDKIKRILNRELGLDYKYQRATD